MPAAVPGLLAEFAFFAQKLLGPQLGLCAMTAEAAAPADVSALLCPDLAPRHPDLPTPAGRSLGKTNTDPRYGFSGSTQLEAGGGR